MAYTYIVSNFVNPGKAFMERKIETIEEAYNAFTHSPFTCEILDFNGDKMSKAEMEERIAGKTHVVQAYFPTLQTTFEGKHVWFKTSRSVDMFTNIRIVGSDNVTYDGIIVAEDFVKVLPARMGKKTI